VQVADSVYAFIGDLGEVGAANGGDIGNSGFIVGSSGVIVIDTGISYRHGKAMIDDRTHHRQARRARHQYPRRARISVR
jgi:alkyl sulfatase BDS1-like metallo-beta-lactamase superfamily hydrolase